MSGYIEGPVRTFQAGGAIAKNLRVKLSAGVLAAAGAAEQSIGTIEIAALASGDKVPVRVANAQGTRKMVASAAITSDATVYGAAGGKISATANGNPEGIALEAAAGDESIIEVLPLSVLDTLLGVQGLAAGYKIARGVHTQVAASDTVVTGLATVVAVVANFSSAPTVKQLWCHASIGDQAGSPAAGSVLISTLKPTAVDNCTPTAATDFSENLGIAWVAVGT